MTSRLFTPFITILSLRFIILLVLILFLSGCASYDMVKHKGFSLRIPAWEQQEIITADNGEVIGFITSDKNCLLNLSIAKTPYYLQLAQPYFEQFQNDTKGILLDYSILDNWVTLSYQLPEPDPVRGETRILACASGWAYVVDYQCSAQLFSSYEQDIKRSIASLTC